MESLSHFFSDIYEESSYLNRSHSRKLQLYLSSIHPKIEILFKLTAINHRCSVEFTKISWERMFHRKSDIIVALSCLKEKTFFVNEELKVFSEKMHNRCAICFLDQRGSRVNMMKNTFMEMMRFSTDSAFDNIIREVKKTAERLDSFMEYIITTCDQLKVENVRLMDYLANVRTHINGLCTNQEDIKPKLLVVYRGSICMDNESDEYRSDVELCECDCCNHEGLHYHYRDWY